MTGPRASQTVAVPGGQLHVEEMGDWVEVHGPEPDPAWKYVDAATHGHFWVGTDTRAGGVSGGPDNYPTLEWVPEPCRHGHGDDCDAEGHWECPECHEHIVPGVRPVSRFWVSHGRRYQLAIERGTEVHHYSFGDAQYQLWLEAIALATDTALGDFKGRVERRGVTRSAN